MTSGGSHQTDELVPPALPVPGIATGQERGATGLTLAALLMLGSAIGVIDLAVQGVVRDGASRWIYATTMLVLAVMAVPLLLRRRIGRLQTFALVLLGDLVYLTVALCIEDPARYAPPLMLLFPAFVAAWFLGRWELGVQLVVTPVVCLLAMASSYPTGPELVVQIVASSGILDITAVGVFVLRRRMQSLLQQTRALSSTDPLTGLSNRRHLTEQAPRVWRQARRDGMQVAAMVLDLDHFKRLNDEHGHAAGDLVLRAVAESLGRTVRPADVLARTGGEEIVVVGAVGDLAEASRLAERLRAAVAASGGPARHRVTASVGVALARPIDGADPDAALWQLIDRADGAMYEAKRQGRDRVAVARPLGPRPVLPPEGRGRTDEPRGPGRHRATGEPSVAESAATDVA